MAEKQQQTAVVVSPFRKFNDTLRSVRTQEYLTDMLGSKKETFVTNLVAVVANNTSLQQCDPMSLIYSAMKATALDFPLDPNFGFAYLIPYKDNKAGVTLAQLQFGYKAYIQLSQRSGQFRFLNATDIRDGELVSKDFLTGEYIFKEEKDRLNKKIIGYAATFVLNNGFRKTLYMTVEEMEAHAKRYSQTYRSDKKWIHDSSKWATDFDAMAIKTVIKLLLSKYAPLSAQMKDAVTYDQAAFTSSGEMQYIDAPEDQTQATVEKAVEAHRREMRETRQEDEGMFQPEDLP